jgi:anti-sigma B factor antagonist
VFVDDRQIAAIATALKEPMSLAITTRIISGVVILDMSGRLLPSEGTLRVYIRQQLEAGYRSFVLNLTDLPYIDSFGLGELVTMWTSIRSAGGESTLLSPTENIRKLLRITKLDSVFQISADEAGAVRSLTSVVAT